MQWVSLLVPSGLRTLISPAFASLLQDWVAASYVEWLLFSTLAACFGWESGVQLRALMKWR